MKKLLRRTLPDNPFCQMLVACFGGCCVLSLAAAAGEYVGRKIVG